MTNRNMDIPEIDSAGVVRAYTGIPGFVRGDSFVLMVDDGAGSKAAGNKGAGNKGAGSKGTLLCRARLEKKSATSTTMATTFAIRFQFDCQPCRQTHSIALCSTSLPGLSTSVPLPSWKSYPLKAAATQQTCLSTTAHNLWLDWNAENEIFSLRIYGNQSGLSGHTFSLAALGTPEAPNLTLNVNQLSVTITPGASEIQLTFWTQDDLFDFLLQLLALLKSGRGPACDEQTPAMKIEEEHPSPKLRTFSTASDISDDNNIDVRSQRFRLQLLDRTFEVYRAVHQTGLTEMYTLLLKQVEDILRCGDEDLQVALAQHVRKQTNTPQDLKDCVATLMHNLLRDVSVEDDLDFKANFKVALAEALRRAGRG
ncbi:hypothetical protein BU16DRAFT_620738 [Lophium mytilinum]|uniref:Uncharacterized protein n=1 Tax=Lophium mytilinum TaxID=390894 RepID=A0A6A6QIV2_9PEZI|nr:hypothetical protein BU16DRAFT_620738 [Lophium mytilinum]